MIYLDTNIIFNYIFQTELTSYSVEVLSLPDPKVTSDTVINEAIFVTLRKLAKDKAGISSTLALKKSLKSGKLPPVVLTKAYSYVKATLKAYDVITIPENVDWETVIILAQKYSLLPSDARILATVLKSGISKLATLDMDFSSVSDVVELWPKSFWG
ncbi:PIN domain-containing protein [Thermococcus sp. MAR1]|uniref:PIN domain-containing protein n=1 Tax=Thermococcus sp. MAR1 TaxID=1638263 RepID=UPI001439893E|nr:PIN domain-containing protein [Thermococcus sp. MAR1]